MWYEKELTLTKSAVMIIGGAILGVTIGAFVGLGYANFSITVPSDCSGEIEARRCMVLGLGWILIIAFAAISGAVDGAIVAAYNGSFRGVIGGLIVVSLGGGVIAGLASNGVGALFGALMSASTAALVGLVIWLIGWVARQGRRTSSKADPGQGSA